MHAKAGGPFVLVAVLLVALPANALHAEEIKPPEECPLGTPLSGKWRVSAGTMQVDHVMTFGGGSTTMTVEVFDCGAKIMAKGGGGIGTVTFIPTDKEPPVDNAIGIEKWLTKENDTIEYDPAKGKNDPALLLAVTLVVIVADDYLGWNQRKPLLLFKTGHYRAQFRDNVGWYLDPITSYHMVSVTTSEQVEAPPHTQYHYWRWIEELDAEN